MAERIFRRNSYSTMNKDPTGGYRNIGKRPVERIYEYLKNVSVED